MYGPSGLANRVAATCSGDPDADLEHIFFRKFAMFFHPLFHAGFIQVLHDEIESPILFSQG
ncbi:MAG: hypothetical protein EBX67_05580, partial [Betaproteobacteria bacterium]|nr:hypothetical protein [Betaproteobacteria bacterium]